MTHTNPVFLSEKKFVLSLDYLGYQTNLFDYVFQWITKKKLYKMA